MNSYWKANQLEMQLDMTRESLLLAMVALELIATSGKDLAECRRLAGEALRAAQERIIP